MSTVHVLDAQFITTAVEKKGYPRERLPEVAFIGRSNVGKSSMINTLTGRKKLVRVSNTPGRTRALNFFEVDLRRGEKELRIRLADLPGYGFARVSKTERSTWQAMINDYLSGRNDLKVGVSIIDAEVGPTEDDLQTLEYLQDTVKQILLVATKIDRLPKARRKPRLQQLADQLELPREAVIGFSSTDKLGLDEVWGALIDACS